MLNQKLTVELHVHTCFSPDSLMSLQQLADTCKRKRIDCIAITDHNTIDGAIAFKNNFSGIRVIIGEEISTAEGEIIGYFIQQAIKPGLSAAATIAAIKEQGGLVCVPHPFDRRRSGVLKECALLHNLEQIDLIERFNGRNLNDAANHTAYIFAKLHNKVTTVGADAHTYQELGRCRMVIDDFSDPNDFLNKLIASQSVTKQVPVWKNILYSGLPLIKRAVMPFLCSRCLACPEAYLDHQTARSRGQTKQI